MRRRALFAVLALVAGAKADDLLLMPTAKRVLEGGVHADVWFNDQLATGSLATGLGPSWDAQVSVDRFGSDPGRPTASLAYYYLSPIGDIAPGISGGILDAANETTDGRRVYVCATMNRSLTQNSKLGFTELTAGFEAGRRPSPMAGVRTPVVKSISFLAEYDGYRFNEGIEAKLSEGFYGRLTLREAVSISASGFGSNS